MQADPETHSTPQQTARTALRQATGAVHDAVHNLPLMRGLTDGHLTRDAYADLTQRLCAYYEILDAGIVAACRRLVVPPTLYDYALRAPLLRADLAAMSVTTPPRSATTAAHRPLTEFATPADLAGAAYVVEGALMGAKLLERALPPETATADSRRFWTWSAAAGPRRWAMTRGFIETACPSSCEREAAIKTAIAVFGLFRDIVSKDLAELPH